MRRVSLSLASSLFSSRIASLSFLNLTISVLKTSINASLSSISYAKANERERKITMVEKWLGYLFQFLDLIKLSFVGFIL